VPEHRRQTTIRPIRAAAQEHELTKSVELEQRVGRLEMDVRDLRTMLQSVLSRLATLQAQLDHTVAKQLF
jgi:hypothetical protein